MTIVYFQFGFGGVFSEQTAMGANVLENGTYDLKNSNCFPESMT